VTIDLGFADLRYYRWPAAPAVTTIPGYATEQDCKTAGQQVFQQGGELSLRVFCVPGPSGK
jgi:hypothetical protein